MWLAAIRDYHRRMSLHRKVFFSSLSMLFLIPLVDSIAYWRILITHVRGPDEDLRPEGG